MSDETTLLPCPFCGGEARLKEYKPTVSGVAICRECGARSPICKNDHTGGWKPKAIAAWNARAAVGNGTCHVECFDDGVDEGLDGKWFSYAPPTWYLSCGHTSQGTEAPSYCMRCGKAVVRWDD